MKHFYLSVFLLLMIYTHSSAQNTVTKPSFPGGVAALMEFLNNNIHYPEDANKNRMEGKTLVSFIVNEDGSISDIKIKKSSWQILDDEAVRVVQLMPKWMPAQLHGKPRKEMVVLPIVFDLKLMKDKTRLAEKE
ncbi:MAG: energy transducer TonB [Chitinophagales bacterium]